MLPLITKLGGLLNLSLRNISIMVNWSEFDFAVHEKIASIKASDARDWIRSRLKGLEVMGGLLIQIVYYYCSAGRLRSRSH